MVGFLDMYTLSALIFELHLHIYINYIIIPRKKNLRKRKAP